MPTPYVKPDLDNNLMPHHMENNDDHDHMKPKNEPKMILTTPKGDTTDGDDSDPDEDDGNRGDGRGLRPNERPNSTQDRDLIDDTIDNLDEYKKRLGINGLMRVFNGKPTFSRNWEENLDCFINIFNTLSTMCELTNKEKVK